MPPPGHAPLVFVTVGTDHHPFDRLIHWMDRWLELVGPERLVGLEIAAGERSANGHRDVHVSQSA